MKRIALIATCALMTCASASAQEEAEPKLVIEPTDRILMDAGAIHSIDEILDNQLNDGVAIPDVRMGVSATYGKWKAKVDAGYTRQSLLLEDTNPDYNFNKESLIRMGYFVHRFGLQSDTSSGFEISVEEPLANQIFPNSRLIDVMHVHAGEKFHVIVSVLAENDATKMTTDKLGNETRGAMTRLVWRPLARRGKISHIGISGAHESPRYNKGVAIGHKSYTLKVPPPTRITNVAAQKAKISDAKTLWKSFPEMNFAIGSFGFKVQYFYVGIKRDSAIPNYSTWGIYSNVRCPLNGQGYTYAKADTDIATPDPGSLELVAAYNYSTLVDRGANVFGGKVNDWSSTFNYYLSRYMIWHVHGSITCVTDNAAFNSSTFSILETRLRVEL